jgi:nitroimidazol reductase NimA-like FMN-containing flavoprotein (pyridoxamine 5'-phosphate oxidase superfamily)
MKPHHGDIQTLSPGECQKLLETSKLGHLGCHTKDEIYVVPITYIFDNNYFLCHSRQGKKIEIMRKNPKVCIQVEEVKDFFNWKSVIAWGDYEELKGDDAMVAMLSLISKIYEPSDNPHLSSLARDMCAVIETSMVFRIKVQKLSGRFETREILN